MQVGTEILLARMKEYPDEFFSGNYDSRWGNIIDEARSYLPKEDVEALDNSYRQMQVDRFNERVLARLAGEDKQETEEKLKYKITEPYAGGVMDPRAILKQQPYEQQQKDNQYLIDQQHRARNAAQQDSYRMGYNSIKGTFF
jgi:hypothetical protein